jgi:hypothetical protein
MPSNQPVYTPIQASFEKPEHMKPSQAFTTYNPTSAGYQMSNVQSTYSNISKA